MERDLGSIGVLALRATGTAAVLVGLWLPWFVVEPNHVGAIPSIYLSGTTTGIGGFDYLILAATLGGAMSEYRGSARARARVAVATAILTLALTVWYISRTTGLDGTYLDVFVVGKGASLTLFGGGLLLIAGVLRYVLVGTTEPHVTVGTDSD